MIGQTMVSAPLGVAGAYPSHIAALGKGGVHVFSTLAERDAMGDELKDITTVALVGVGDNGYPSWYKWESNKWNFEGYFGGMVIADVDGALTRVDSTAVLGPDFKIQAAGDTGNGVLIMLSDDVKAEIAKSTAGGAPSATLSVGQSYGSYASVNNVNEIEVFWPLEAAQARVAADQTSPGVATLSINPNAYEPHHSEGYLAYFDMDEIVLGNTVPSAGRRKGAIWADSVAWGANNVDLYAERESKSVILQEADGKDPNVTGGVPILCGLHIGFYGKAPQDGTIECKLVDSMTGAALEDAAGQPIGIIHHYKKGDELKPLTAVQVYRAKGAVKASWIPSHTFTDDPLRLEDWAVAGSCMMFQQMGKGESISPVLNEFQEVVGKPIKVMQKYYGVSVAGNKWALSFDTPQQTITAGTTSDSVIGVDFENPTDAKIAVENGIFNVKDTGSLCLFNLGVELSAEDTRNLRGKVVTVKTEVLNRLSATNLCMLVYTGNLKDVSRPVLKDMHNDSYVLGDGWDYHDHAFLAEHPEGGLHPLEKDFVIPNDAGLVMFSVIPAEKQSPMDVSVKAIEVDVKNPFTAYTVSVSPGSDQLQYQIVNSQFVTHPTIWAVDPRVTNLPMGEYASVPSKAPVKLFAEEDNPNTYSGGIILEDVTDYKIELWLQVVNFFKAKLTGDETLNFWVATEDGDVIAGSDTSLVLKDGDYAPHLVNWHFDYNNLVKGTKLRLYGQSSSTKVGYLAGSTYNAAGVSVDAKVVP